MSDPRLTPDPAKIAQQKDAQLIVPVADLCRSPNGPRDRQLLFGARVTCLDASLDGWTYVQAQSDHYVGYLPSATLGEPHKATHLVSAPATHAYKRADLKSPDVIALSHLSKVSVLNEGEDFFETAQGFIPRQHLTPITATQTDPAKVAELYLGTDYLWGGNSRWGIDCSGLVQAALHACGIPCPGDSDMQMALGEEVSGPCQRNDLLFWKGHVALVSDPETIIHANAHTMAVNYEPIKEAVQRIADKGDGPVTAHRRLSLS